MLYNLKFNFKQISIQKFLLFSPQRDSNLQALSSQTNIQPFSKTVHKLLGWKLCLSTCLYGAFECIFLPCHVRVSEWMYTLQLPECQGTPCSKQAQYLKSKWLQRDSNRQPLSLWMKCLMFVYELSGYRFKWL